MPLQASVVQEVVPMDVEFGQLWDPAACDSEGLVIYSRLFFLFDSDCGSLRKILERVDESCSVQQAFCRRLDAVVMVLADTSSV